MNSLDVFSIDSTEMMASTQVGGGVLMSEHNESVSEMESVQTLEPNMVSQQEWAQ